MHLRAELCFAAIVSLISFSGCGGSLAPTEPKGLREKMFDTVPLTGKVVLDGGAPGQMVVSAFNEKELEGWKQRKDFPSPNDPIAGTAITSVRPEGTFTFQTHKANDGLPAGNWVLLFSKGGTGFNAFNKKYNNPLTSTFKVTLEKGKPVDLGEIKLSSK